MEQIRNPKPACRKARSEIRNSRFKYQIAGFTVLFLVFLLVSNALAIGGGGGEHHDFTWKDWLWPLVNFAILVFILVFAGRKPVREFFKKRTEMIEESLKEAREAKELARKSLEEVQERLRNTDTEIEKMLEAAKKSGEKEKEAIIAEGVKIKERILEQAKSSIEFELQRAKETIKSDAALLALEMAEKQIKEKLGQKEQDALIDDYIKRLEAKN